MLLLAAPTFADFRQLTYLLRECQSIVELQKEGYLMTEKQWMARIVSRR
jgi:hypothetical protein